VSHGPFGQDLDQMFTNEFHGFLPENVLDKVRDLVTRKSAFGLKVTCPCRMRPNGLFGSGMRFAPPIAERAKV